MKRIYYGKVVRDRTAQENFFLRNELMDKIYTSETLFKEWEGKTIMVSISDLDEKKLNIKNGLYYV